MKRFYSGTGMILLVLALGCKKNNPYTVDPPSPTICDTSLTFSYLRSHDDYTFVSFTATAQELDNKSFKWQFGDGSTSSDQNPNHHYPAGAATYSVVLEMTTTCGDQITRNITVQINDAYTYAFKLTNYTYHLEVQSESAVDVTASGDYNEGENSSNSNGSLHCVVGNDHSFSINHHSKPSLNGVDYYFNIGFWQTNYTSFGAPPAGSYGNTQSGATLTYSNTGSNVFIIGNQGGTVGGITAGGSSAVTISRSDSVIIGSFTCSLLAPGSAAAGCIGSFQAARYKRYY